tara:strand:+ start:423 stop:644 length:222 start_codon:yes stop_codon:yes gene_type:complete
MYELYQGFLNFLKAPSPVVIAARELDEARRQLLQSQSAAEYAIRISAYHQDRIKRLSAYLVEANKADASNPAT